MFRKSEAFDFELNKKINSLNCCEHFHRSFEYIGQVHGSATVTVDGKTFELDAGEAVLIFPFQTHSYFGVECQCESFRFSSELVDDYFKSYNGNFPRDNLFSFKLPSDFPTDNVYMKRSLAYLLCGEFEKQNPYRDVTSEEPNVLVSLLLYVEKNYCGKCSLKDAALELGWEYSYLSKVFKEKTEISFNKYVNSLRIKKSKMLIDTSDRSFSEIMLECGFTSLRSFERNFKAITSLSPSEYREKASYDAEDFADL